MQILQNKDLETIRTIGARIIHNSCDATTLFNHNKQN